ncbi:hypothetical protein BS50DRAFT_628296 [Corynespora cassiicola Philippines]|uniref:Uncharacterized protein n=1 Tax=Corynespora cassiicola Philippines TaxID=1448308 RepID=A0A2T2PBZ0_CORCC|nr:hypothetical protein BS50DRAFT_628296 [Corynespora cassiicola Philippines]
MAVIMLEKRDNMGWSSHTRDSICLWFRYAIHPFGIVLLSMLGAGLLVAVGAGIWRVMYPNNDGWKHRSASQEDYMREVRSRNSDALMREGMRTKYKLRTSDPSSSVTPSA